MNDNDNINLEIVDNSEEQADCESYDVYHHEPGQGFFGLKALILFVICLIPLEIIAISYLVFKAS